MTRRLRRRPLAPFCESTSPVPKSFCRFCRLCRPRRGNGSRAKPKWCCAASPCSRQSGSRSRGNRITGRSPGQIRQLGNQNRFAGHDAVAGRDIHGQPRQVGHDQVHLRADADHAEDLPLLQSLAHFGVDVDAVNAAAADLHDVAGDVLARGIVPRQRLTARLFWMMCGLLA